MIKVTNKITGEVIELDDDRLDQVVEAWKLASEFEKMGKYIKDKMKPLLSAMINDNGTSDEVNGYMFRQSFVQRMTYDKGAIFEAIDDEDLRLEMLTPNKGFIDNYLKENIDITGDIATILRSSMVPAGDPYTVIKLEKV